MVNKDLLNHIGEYNAPLSVLAMQGRSRRDSSEETSPRKHARTVVVKTEEKTDLLMALTCFE